MNNHNHQPKFRLSAKRLFLTYQDQDNQINEKIIEEKLNSIFNIKQLVISKETSENQYKHYHVFIEVDKRPNITNPRKLDINGIHGDYKAIRNKSEKTKVITYISKQGQTISKGINLKTEILKSVQKPFDRFIYKCEFLGYHPRILLKNCQNMESYDTDLFEILVDYEKSPAKYDRYINRRSPLTPVKNKPLFIHLSLLSKLNQWKPEKKALYLFGRSGIGKTTLAIQIAKDKGLVIRHKDEMKKVDPNNHQAIIFDDMSFSSYSRESCINLLDMDMPLQFDVKGSMIQVPNSIPRIFTSNHPPKDIFTKFDEPMKRRIEIICLDSYYTPYIAKDHTEININEQSKYFSIDNLDFQNRLIYNANIHI